MLWRRGCAHIPLQIEFLSLEWRKLRACLGLTICNAAEKSFITLTPLCCSMNMHEHVSGNFSIKREKRAAY